MGADEKNGAVRHCSIDVDDGEVTPFIFVIFGGAGDLSKKKLLPMLFSMYLRGELTESFAILGFGRQNLSNDDYRELVREALEASEDTGGGSEAQLEGFSSRCFFHYGHLEVPEYYESLQKSLYEVSAGYRYQIVYYLAVPSSLYGQVIGTIGESSLPTDADKVKIVIEKPFGKNLATAMELNRTVHRVFEESQIFRMDHYLGKETVQNIIFFRFANSIFEPLWNRNYIDSVRITVAEDIGVGSRGRFYEKTGAIRDIFQNHLLQLLSLIAMEPPAGLRADQVRDEKVKVIESLRPVSPDEASEVSVAGQYGPGEIAEQEVRGYREEENVSPGSTVPTFFAAKVHVDNWRWAGVPFYVRTGKRLPRKVTEVVIQFSQPPLKLFRDDCTPLEPTYLSLTIQPEESITLHIGVKYPESTDMIHPVDLSFSYADIYGKEKISPYERLLRDCLAGDQSLFVRQDDVEAAWSYADPFISYWEATQEIPMYRAGTWGPEDAESFIEEDGRSWITG